MEKLQELLEALNLSKETGDKKAQQKSYTDLGNACYDLGQNEKSVEYFEKVFKSIKRSEIKRRKGNLQQDWNCVHSPRQP